MDQAFMNQAVLGEAVMGEISLDDSEIRHGFVYDLGRRHADSVALIL
jgi:hypothetical protein